MCWLDQHAAAVQALCAMLGVLGLFVYTYLTWELRSTSIRQATASQRPLLVLLEPDEVSPGHFIRNMGSGPAVRIAWKVGIDNDREWKVWNNVGVLAVSDWSNLPHWDQKEPRLIKIPKTGIRIHYADLTGNYYCLTATPALDDLPGVKILILQDECGISKKECCGSHR